MIKYLLSLLSIAIFFNVFSQDSYSEVYDIFQNKCMPCHSNATKTANLNLEGAGATVKAKMASVYAGLYKKNPSNTAAVSAKNSLVYPGDPYKSFLYRKIDNNLTPGLVLHTGEGATEPNSQTPLSDKEIEFVRQWILYGAFETGTLFDKTLLEDYYDNGGVNSVSNPPMPPADGEGFQIHLGPFFLEPNGEIEYFSKYEPKFESDIEVHKLQTEMGDFSHHYIAYKFSSTLGNLNPATVPYGMRPGQDFDSRELISVDQYSGILELPKGSAFLWEQNTIFDLNSHYINYSSTQVLKCEVFYNVYTQPVGEANQIMEVILVPNTNIPIPNNNVPVTHSANFNLAADVNIYVWGLVAHTHKYGKDFNIYKRNSNGTRGVQIYDAGCVDGLPGCTLEDFDYAHLPIKFNYPFLPINIQDGVEMEATYQNNGPNSVNWGFTSADEMMIFVAFYVTDTTGVQMVKSEEPLPNGVSNIEKEIFRMYPNPANSNLTFEFKDLEKNYTIDIYDLSLRKVESKIVNGTISLDVNNWTKGMYIYQVKSEGKSIANGKFAKD